MCTFDTSLDPERPPFSTLPRREETPERRRKEEVYALF